MARPGKDFEKIAKALKAAGDKGLQKEVSKAIREEARPLGRRVLEEGADELPESGGLADRVRDLGRVGVSASLAGRVASVRIILRNKGAGLGVIDRGIIRHPVYPRFGVPREEWTWTEQPVRAGAFSRPFRRQVGPVRKAALKGAKKALSDAARSV